jgi:hypothetical protein
MPGRHHRQRDPQGGRVRQREDERGAGEAGLVAQVGGERFRGVAAHDDRRDVALVEDRRGAA